MASKILFLKSSPGKSSPQRRRHRTKLYQKLLFDHKKKFEKKIYKILPPEEVEEIEIQLLLVKCK